MTERRPHWDDDLVYAVIHEIGVLRPSPHSLRDTAYAVIAAVEDWHAEQEEENLPLLVAMLNAEAVKHVRRAKDAEAAIARVRALHKPCIEAPVEEGGCKPGKCDWRACMADGLDWPCNTIRALDGDA